MFSMTCISLSLSVIRHWQVILMLFLPWKWIGQGFQPSLLSHSSWKNLWNSEFWSWRVRSAEIMDSPLFGHKIVRMVGIFRTFWSTWIPGVCPGHVQYLVHPPTLGGTSRLGTPWSACWYRGWSPWELFQMNVGAKSQRRQGCAYWLNLIDEVSIKSSSQLCKLHVTTQVSW